MDRSFLTADIDDLVRKLSLEEKISLLGAPAWWNTTPIGRLSIPLIRMSDGPNGVRGASHFRSTPGQCIPCATALAATFDADLIHEVGQFLAEEAKAKAAVILLAPTCNIQRSPLGGRAFESFSEDPHLSGIMAAAYVNGLQSRGISATIKHFVANDQEHERTAADSVMSDRALREVYLYPFMLSQKLAQPSAFMTSYGRIHGVHCSENSFLLQDILRDEWKFPGIVMSDWYGTYSVAESINAGLDLEMPGPPRWRAPDLVQHSLTAQKILVPTINDRAHSLLTFLQHQARQHPDIVYGDGKEGSNDSPEARKFCRRLAADGIVLLKNDDDILPLKQERVKRIAVVGPNAKERVISGGGSAALRALYTVSPFEGIENGAYDGLVIDYEKACYAHKYLPTLEQNLVTPSGKTGWLCTFYNQDENGCLSEPVAEYVLKDTRIKLNDFLPEGMSPNWTIKLTGKLTFEKNAPYELGLTVAGRAKLFLNGKLAIDNWTKQRRGDFFYGQGTVEEKAVVNMTAGKSVDLLVEYTNTPSESVEGEDKDEVQSQPALMRGVRLGGCEKVSYEDQVDAALAVARKADAVVFVAGLTPEWESEGFDRPSLAPPGPQDDAISRIAEANLNIVVVVQCGSAISMPWVNSVKAIVQTWYLGNEVGNAIADILYGKVNPSGRLSLSFPTCEEDIAAFPHTQSENGKIYYHEDVFVGYRHHLARGIKPLFPFGHGLSYTTFSVSDVSMALSKSDDEETMKISVNVKNVGKLTGSQVVQLYVTYPDLGLAQPPMLLKGFAKARDLAPGASTTLTIDLDKYAVSFWDTRKKAWKIAQGVYKLNVGVSSVEIVFSGDWEVKKDRYWTGL